MKFTLFLVMPIFALIGLLGNYFVQQAAATQEVEALGRIKSSHISVSRDYINLQLSELSQVLADAKAVPYIPLSSNGKVKGFKIVKINPGSLYENIGLKKGDIVVGSNGQSLDTPQRAMDLYQNLKSKEQLQIEIIRQGQLQDLIIEVE